MIRILKTIWNLILLLLPLVVFAVGLPLGEKADGDRYQIYTVITLYIFLVLSFLGRTLAGFFDRHIAISRLTLILLLVSPLAAWILVKLDPHYCGAAALGLLGFLSFAWGVCSLSKTLPAPSLLSLIIVVAGFIGIERFLDSLPAEILHPQVVMVPPLAPVDRGNQLYRKNGFRGKRPCVDCADRGLRIFTIGGSSTYGTPMFYPSDSFSARLERLLRERRPSEKWEVYNAGIPGYGIMQIQDSIDKELSKYKPDIIAICAWFNDSSAIPGWYGFHSQSDKEAHELVDLLRRIEGSWLYRRIQSTRIYGAFRFTLLMAQPKVMGYLMSDKKGRNRPRMSPEEFSWALERIREFSMEHGFLPIIITEAINRTPSLEAALPRNRYYQVMREFTEKHDLPFVNTLDSLANRRGEWLFYDFIHPNQSGHQIIAEKIYDYLLSTEPHPKLKAIYQKRNINFSAAAVQRNHRFQVRRKGLAKKQVKLIARLLNADPEKFVLELNANEDSTMIQTGLSNQASEFLFHLDAAALRRPIIDLTLRARSLAELEGNEHGGEAPYLEVSEFHAE